MGDGVAGKIIVIIDPRKDSSHDVKRDRTQEQRGK